MRTIFCKEELDQEDGMSSFSEEQLAKSDNQTTAFYYNVGESMNEIRRRKTVFKLQQFILWWNILMDALWHDMN